MELSELGDRITDGQYSIVVSKISKNAHGIVYCGKMITALGMACIPHSEKVRKYETNTNEEIPGTSQ